MLNFVRIRVSSLSSEATGAKEWYGYFKMSGEQFFYTGQNFVYSTVLICCLFLVHVLSTICPASDFESQVVGNGCWHGFFAYHLDASSAFSRTLAST